MENSTTQEGIINLHGMQITIPRDKELVLGRSAVCDIMLQHDMVSKRHSRFFYSLGRYFVEDLNSANGTRVNQERISGVRGLVAGDEIMIYPYSMQFFIQEVDPNGVPAESVGGGKEKAVRCVHFSGRIDILSIVDLIQMLHSTTQTGVLTITDPEDEQAVIQFIEGHIVSARYGKASDELAIYNLVLRSAGDFEFERKKIPYPEKPMATPTVPLLFEACRIKDEAQEHKLRGDETVILQKSPLEEE
jgi:pSer/pThr/pTyr-binding forkhead associated (FHA) protein